MDDYITLTTVATLMIIVTIILLYYSSVSHNMVYITSDVDSQQYLVRDVSDKQVAVNMLAKIRQKMNYLADFLYTNIESYKDKDGHKEYIMRLHDGLKNSIISESAENTVYTSYSVNKGEQIVFCLRSKLIHGQIHDFNLIMYVVLHEMSHVACPEIGHTALFKQIFAFLATEAIKLNLYTKIDFNAQNREYCGMTITDSIV
jgi:hypothetical protein